MTFRWRPGEPPPQIEEHSKAKLNVLRRYLRAYFDRLSVNPSRKEFKLDLVDGFCGGGTFKDGGGTESGTPLVMIEESEAARERLNRGRSKPLRLDFKYYFVDADPFHTAHLQEALNDRGYADPERVILRNSRFEDEADAIIAAKFEDGDSRRPARVDNGRVVAAGDPGRVPEQPAGAVDAPYRQRRTDGAGIARTPRRWSSWSKPLEIGLLFRRVRAQVLASTNGAQRPHEYHHAPGQVALGFMYDRGRGVRRTTRKSMSAQIQQGPDVLP